MWEKAELHKYVEPNNAVSDGALCHVWRILILLSSKMVLDFSWMLACSAKISSSPADEHINAAVLKIQLLKLDLELLTSPAQQLLSCRSYSFLVFSKSRGCFGSSSNPDVAALKTGANWADHVDRGCVFFHSSSTLRKSGNAEFPQTSLNIWNMSKHSFVGRRVSCSYFVVVCSNSTGMKTYNWAASLSVHHVPPKLFLQVTAPFNRNSWSQKRFDWE